MEDWQEWQIRADQVAASLNQEVDALETEFLSADAASSLRGFWPRFRQLKEQVRTAPAIKLEDKLELERRLRSIGGRGYKVQQEVNSSSTDRKAELLAAIAEIRTTADTADTPRDLRLLRRQLDPIRSQFDAGPALVPADRQAIWEQWRDTNQHIWDRLTQSWNENEEHLTGILSEARQKLEQGNSNAVRQLVSRFFESLRTHETKQEVVNKLKAEAEALRTEVAQAEERRAAQVVASRGPAVSPVETWRADLDRNREAVNRLREEVAALDRQVQETRSVLDQAMLRGPLNEKRQKLAELERTNRVLEQRLEQAEETPAVSSA